jgi:GMP synthase-like glutamine amidotransferase
MKNRTQPKIAILSSVKPWIFSSLANDPKYTSQEREKALMQEIDVWNSTLEIDYIKENTKFEVINIINWLPKSGIYDGYILGWSPNMVWEDLDWIKNLKKFIYEEITKGKPALWICFWHQILATAFWWTLENAYMRNIWKDQVFLNSLWQWDALFSQMSSNFESLWSHKQFVSRPWEAEVLWDNWHTPNQIIKIWENARGCQFHPEFSKEFTSFLVKLMQWSIEQEGLDIQRILWDLEKMNGHEWKKVITLFIQSMMKNK